MKVDEKPNKKAVLPKEIYTRLLPSQLSGRINGIGVVFPLADCAKVPTAFLK